MLATAVLVVNNLRDRTTDAKVGKKTLAVRFGAEFARLEYVVCILLSYVSVAVGYFVLDFPMLAFLVLASTPLAGNEIKSVATKDGRALNPHLGGTARFCVVFSFLLAAGFIFG